MCETAVTVGLVTIPSTAAAAPAADTGYDEPYRPQFHYTPRQNWMNDPNGPIVYKGQYHLFYQYNPEGNQWGNMSRGHAVSKDLVSWKELPLAIPFDDRELIFSGGGRQRQEQQQRPGNPQEPAAGGDLHERQTRVAGAITGLQHGRRNDLDEI